MNFENKSADRRTFLKQSGIIAAGIPGYAFFSQNNFTEKTADEEINIIGPKEGYSPQIGTLVSELTWMRFVVLRSVQKMNQTDLDFLFDANSNTIGAMLMHLAATESFYQLNTFQDLPWEKFPENEKKQWDVAMNLGEPARNTIKGHDLAYYTNMLDEVRAKTLTEFKKRDDQWLMKVDPHFFANKPTNNYCKWFHVCEHESNHNGQIKWIAKRIPGSKAGGD